MKKLITATFVISVLLISSCKNNSQPKTVKRDFPEIHITPPSEEAESYRASITKTHDLVHMDLAVSFDWSRKYLYGKAAITVKPHFYPSSLLIFNARGMQINRVALIEGADTTNLSFRHENDSLFITTQNYKSNETFKVFIDYIARPDELKDIGGSQAINSDKGLYFINPDGADPEKPKQIWTQGETQANSVWFPTIDAPNQKFTHRISITIGKEYKTLSNGLMISSTENSDGTRTDVWSQDLPHAPYLVMMAIGRFSIVTDKWRNIDVNYYVEPKYEKVARKIFGNTPEMIDFFSKKLGVDYPWAKYSQVVVRDYVSGAMENTSATLHGEYLQQDERELLDGNNEDVVSHELFHHWFGDYVTCESWSNIPLNESFATYGEYLWNEFKYGREEADIGRLNDLNAYLRESKTKKVNLIRFQFDNKEDMFDRHSYQKGGCILHVLRKTVGDDAFFAALKLYLQTNAFRPVEVHQLRLAFEEVTGKDMNWFFNQWFLSKGHPVLTITYGWDENAHIASMTVKQEQDLSEEPLFILPLTVDIYENGKARRENITIHHKEQTFTFSCNVKPDFINFDAEKMLVATKTDKHSKEEWISMYKYAPLFQDRFEALNAISKDYNDGTPEADMVLSAMKDKNWKIRENAIAKSEVLCKGARKEQVQQLIMDIGMKDPKSSVRDEAIGIVDDHFSGDDLIPYFQNATRDSSFDVVESAFMGLASERPEIALRLAASYEKEEHERMYAILASLYSKYGSDAQMAFMNTALTKSTGFSTYTRLQQYSRFLQRCKQELNISSGITKIFETGRTSENWVVRLSAVQSLTEFGNYCAEQSKSAAKSGDTALAAKWENDRNATVNYIDALKKNEKNEMLLKIYNTGSH
ncbi:MAG: M1 family aminopeptidase [Bacteroidia bacterium]